MTETQPQNNIPEAGTEPVQPTPEESVQRISGLLSGLIDDQQLPLGSEVSPIAIGTPRSKPSPFENELAVVRLGMATSLFYALRTKHPPTATHSIRVAIACSAWCDRLAVDDTTRDRIEVAALLHDIGKIGVPDAILKKPGRLTTEEQAVIALCPRIGIEILQGCTEDEELLDIIRLNPVWFDSRRVEEGIPQGTDIPLGARMLSIVEAFDSMTTDHVYRPAMSRERALAELSRYSGSQFDPQLARDYHQFLESHPEVLHGCVVDRWLKELHASESNSRWNANKREPIPGVASNDSIDRFFRQLMIHTHDGVAFIDNQGVVRAWNAALYELSGIKSDAVCGNAWDQRILGICQRNGKALEDRECPIRQTLRHGGHTTHQLALALAGQSLQLVNLRVSGVTSPETGVQGVVAMFQDATQQAHLEQRVQDLSDRVTRDPLTGIANRAEFDKRLVEMSDEASEGNTQFSLVICDIDRFKTINDTYGHPAGDEAIVKFAQILNEHCRDGDLVARYGGEEFVLLCPNCDNAAAAAKAEEVRQAIETTPLSFLDGTAITASFGVTEFQLGDTSESVLARADRALLRAKDNGRNRVIQLGSGGFKSPTDAEERERESGWLKWIDFGRNHPKQDVTLSTPVPIDFVVEKLKGFVADHHAEILKVGEHEIEIRIVAVFRVGGRRRTDQRMEFMLYMNFDETEIARRGAAGTNVGGTQTLISVAMRPVKSRDRRNKDVSAGAAQLLRSLRSYLMADIVDPNC